MIGAGLRSLTRHDNDELAQLYAAAIFLPTTNSNQGCKSMAPFAALRCAFAPRTNCDHSRRAFLGLHPLCGIGVVSETDTISSPDICSPFTAAIRPAPNPLTSTRTESMPLSRDTSPHLCPHVCAANDVERFAPLNPTEPHEAQLIVRPSALVTVILVLL